MSNPLLIKGDQEGFPSLIHGRGIKGEGEISVLRTEDCVPSVLRQAQDKQVGIFLESHASLITHHLFLSPELDAGVVPDHQFFGLPAHVRIAADER